MFTLSNAKYLFLISIIGWVMAPVLNALGFSDEHKLLNVSGLIQGISWYTLITFSVCINTFARDYRRLLYLKVFGTTRYSFVYTFILVPCMLYAFVFDYYTYLWVCGTMFVMLEYIRTVQNSYADEFHDLEVKRKLTELNK
ncbi:hypothetical protein [Escherichia coli]|uniref:Uncharacterized protein n=2 Tax=Asteriusvirus PBECO4 TaxID=2560463 RepID=L7TI71_9CAUD|nr:hypothetical protein [Escherichia coli]YP_009150676.1 membrane protein [Escherichia phage PBECO4]AXC36619.1 hypothetical protein [Escherichia phage UB]QBO61648.1 hypothetical protein G17_00152 [Escherichia phage vB_EcoM_G17]WNN14476.1 hypothetical protein Sharanji_gp188 [Escherichia phage Sharanji]WPK19271.1 hypothetical protein [Salmonella phage SD-6_S16]AGC35042.1 hypothetical protein [Escherichia phage PBECO4]